MATNVGDFLQDLSSFTNTGSCFLLYDPGNVGFWVRSLYIPGLHPYLSLPSRTFTIDRVSVPVFHTYSIVLVCNLLSEISHLFLPVHHFQSRVPRL